MVPELLDRLHNGRLQQRLLRRVAHVAGLATVALEGSPAGVLEQRMASLHAHAHHGHNVGAGDVVEVARDEASVLIHPLLQAALHRWPCCYSAECSRKFWTKRSAHKGQGLLNARTLRSAQRLAERRGASKFDPRNRKQHVHPLPVWLRAQ